jgi:hypothetical protein
MTGKIESLPCGVEPTSSVAEVVRRRSMSGREFMVCFLSRIGVVA